MRARKELDWGAIIELARNLTVENAQEPTGMTPVKTLSNRGEGV